MGLMKTLRTRLTEPGGSRWRKTAREQEAVMKASTSRVLPLATEDEFDRYALRHSRRAWGDCTRCALREERSQVVWGEGTVGARLFVVGEAPGETEDEQGRPFVGPSGALIRRMLSGLGVEKQDIFISNRCACRPPKNRKPHAAEIEACRTRLETQLKIIRPRVLLLLGATSAGLVGVKEIGKSRGPVPEGKWTEIPREARDNLLSVHVTYHPAYVLRQETKQRRRMAFRLVLFDVRRAVSDLDLEN